ncbi:outer membrane biosynthesis protein TonB [Streptomyces sp. SAI-170]|uniref:ATP-binding protein n=1 Tax=Streptomyces sp. SAI-170 TaxID=3377729 RepID=UPI003C7AA250
MDPNTRGPEAGGHDSAGQPPRQRPPRDPLAGDLGQHAPAQARTTQLVSGDYLLTVNPVDGSEIELCPPAQRPAAPERRTPAERAEAARAAAPAPPGPPRPELPLLGRHDEHERLVRLLARGRSVRLTGPAGSGRTRLLDVVAADCADLAPDGVVRLSGFRRTADELLHDLFHAVHRAPLHRLERAELLDYVREVGAVVVLDDIEFGGAALDTLLDATPECAFLIAATPDVPAPSADSPIEEVFLDGLDRAGGLELLEHAVGRTLTEDEANWAGDLWFESEGLPLRFVQAGALLRQRDRLRAGADALDDYGVFEPEVPVEDAVPAEPPVGEDIPLPSLAEGAAPAALLASRLSACARATLRFAVALGGEIPHQAHLPALVGDTHADAALGELIGCALVSPVGGRHRLAAGVLTQLEAAGYADDIDAYALTAAQHYTWWVGHPSVGPDRVCAEADAVLAALSVLVPLTTVPAEDEESPAVQLARTAAPAFAAGLNWSAWERALRSGAEAARLAGAVSEQAYFHHELGILALCGGQLDRARAELEASIGLRGALADKRGTVAGRRALALVDDRSGTTPGPGLPLGSLGTSPSGTPGAGLPALAAGTTPSGGLPYGGPAPVGALGQLGPGADGAQGKSASPSDGVPAGLAAFPPLHRPDDSFDLVTDRATASGSGPRRALGGLRGLARRNLAATGAGALLVAVLGTVVTLGATSGDNDADDPSHRVGVNPTSVQSEDDDLGGDEAEPTPGGDTGSATSRPSASGTGNGGSSDAEAPPAATDPAEPSDTPSGSPRPTTEPSATSTTKKPPSQSPTSPPSMSPRPTRTESESPTPSSSPTPTQTPTETPAEPPTTNTASGTASASASASESGAGSTPSGSDAVI